MTGKEVKSIRTRLGMTQDEFAAQLKDTAPAVSMWESDTRKVRPMTEKMIRLLEQGKLGEGAA